MKSVGLGRRIACSRIKYLWDYNSNKIMVPQVFYFKLE